MSSQRTSPGQVGADEAVQKAPEVNTSDAADWGKATPLTSEGGGPQQFGPSPNTISETNVAPGSDQHPSSTKGEEQQLHQRPPVIRRLLMLWRMH